MPHVDRRTLLAMATSLALAPSRASAMVGIFSTEKLLSTLRDLAAVEQGDGKPTVHVLVSPGCDHSTAMWDAVQGRLGGARYRWIPFSGRAPFDRWRVARLLELGTPEAMRAILSGLEVGVAPSQFALDLADRQDGIVQTTVGRLAWIATTRPLAAPSLAYDTASGPVFVRGSLPTALLDQVLSSAR